ncbi:MAG: CRISPR-associated helicase Cas3' [Chloroflexota bacterium]
MVVNRHLGIRENEINNILNFGRRNINNYLRKLEEDGKVYKDGLLWFKTEKAAEWLRRFELPADQAFTLYLAARLLVKQSDKKNETAIAVLSRLSEVLKSDIPVGKDIFNLAQTLYKRPNQPNYESHFSQLVKAFLRRQPVTLTYQPYQGKPFTTRFDIYLIEPTSIGHAIYLIGWSHQVNQLRTYKLSRVIEVETNHNEGYVIGQDFQGVDIFDNAWSIMLGEETDRVVLQFSEQVKDRVLETNWHPSQNYTAQEDGTLKWWVDVASTVDIENWIRGWGRDVEVLEPLSLRDKMKTHVGAMAEQYNLQPPAERQPYQWLYAKTDRKEPELIHLLLYHLIDVGQVALQMWEKVFTSSFKQHLSGLLNLETKEAGRFIAFTIALHDLGKASPAYQAKYSAPSLQAKLNEVGFSFAESDYPSAKTTDKKTSHAYITTKTMPDILAQEHHFDEHFARSIAQALGGHHGAWPTANAIDSYNDFACDAWDVARREIVWELRKVFQPLAVDSPPTGKDLNIFLTLFSGFTSVADWLGSREGEKAFPFISDVLPTREYANRSAEQAAQVLTDLGWEGWMPNNKQLRFEQMFDFLIDDGKIDPRPMQSEIIELTKDIEFPSLLIVEAPTGNGKTEIAFYSADTQLQAHGGRGIYIAMPTQATSNQMFDRTKQFLAQRYGQDQLVNLHLAHGQSAFDEAYQGIVLQTIDDLNDTQYKSSGRVAAMSWFNEKSKRTLLAPFGVGTVDQTLLSVLQTKHFFVRLLGLSHKVVIFDEVHAYDTYMSTLFMHLLQWLQTIGTSVIMLSATLPADTRRKFVFAYTGQQVDLPNTYPALTIASKNQQPTIHQLPKPKDYQLPIKWLDPETQINHLVDLSHQGGCIAVICNTVGRAQSIFRELLEQFEAGNLNVDRENLILFHARVPPIWRKDIEEKTKKLFGKPQKDTDTEELIDYRPQGTAIIVATQVIEQSLDLDFDVMLTDLAPIDLLLQRAGRLHRHKRNKGKRQGHERQLTIINPAIEDNGIPSFGKSEFVYDRYILLQTYRTLEHRVQNGALTLPSQTTYLIESTYANEPSDADKTWNRALRISYQKMLDDQDEAESKAELQTVPYPESSKLIYEAYRNLEEDNPEVHKAFQAKTRDIGPTLSLICLHTSSHSDVALLDPEPSNQEVNLNLHPAREQAKQLLQRKINVQDRRLLNHFLSEDTPEKTSPTGWKDSSVLKHTKAVFFENGDYFFTQSGIRYRLSLSHDFGLELITLGE